MPHDTFKQWTFNTLIFQFHDSISIAIFPSQGQGDRPEAAEDDHRQEPQEQRSGRGQGWRVGGGGEREG